MTEKPIPSSLLLIVSLKLNVTLSKYRLLAQSLSMTGSDLNSSSKPWFIQERTSSVVYQEFHDQVMI